MIINIDSDGTVVDFIGVYAKLLRLSNPGLAVTTTPADYNMWREWGMSNDEFMRIMEENAFTIFASAEPILGAVLGLNILIGMGHDIRIVTHKVWPDRPSLTSKSQRGTLEWYDKHGLLPFVDLVFTGGNKQSYPADVVIDDKTNLQWAQPGAWNLLFDQPWNKNADQGAQRVNGWNEIVSLVRTVTPA